VKLSRNHVMVVGLLSLAAGVIILAGSWWGPPGLWLAVALVMGINGYLYLRCGVIALQAMHAYAVSEAEQPVLHRIVRELTLKARIPMPQIYVSPTHAVNALTAGRGPTRAVLCCTEGILSLLDERELRAVVGHELAHIRRDDTFVSSMAAAIASTVMVGTEVELSGRRQPGDRAGHIRRILRMMSGSIAAGVIRLTVGRNREYAADAEAARITGDPLGLASALRKIDASVRQLVLPPERNIVAASHLMIARPLQQVGTARLFSSHPPMAERVVRLEQRAGYRR
jgi:heat shock protein HtpX